MSTLQLTTEMKDRTYANFMARLLTLLQSAAPGAILLLDEGTGAALQDGSPVWFELSDGLSNSSDFDSSAWNDENACWDCDSDMPESSWLAIENPRFA